MEIKLFDQEVGSESMGLRDGASGILFAFDTGGLMLLNHDERVWFSKAAA